MYPPLSLSNCESYILPKLQRFNMQPTTKKYKTEEQKDYVKKNKREKETNNQKYQDEPTSFPPTLAPTQSHKPPPRNSWKNRMHLIYQSIHRLSPNTLSKTHFYLPRVLHITARSRFLYHKANLKWAYHHSFIRCSTCVGEGSSLQKPLSLSLFQTTEDYAQRHIMPTTFCK